MLNSGFEPRGTPRDSKAESEMRSIRLWRVAFRFPRAVLGCLARRARQRCAVRTPRATVGLCGEDAKANCEQRHSARAPQRGLRLRVARSTARLEAEVQRR